jgi:hypothetical protein
MRKCIYRNQRDLYFMKVRKKVYKLAKSLYDLKKALKQWHEKFDKIILLNGFHYNSASVSFFLKKFQRFKEFSYILKMLFLCGINK